MARKLALVVAFAFMAVPVVNADPVVFPVNSFTQGSNAVVEDFTIAQYAWGTTDFIDSTPDNGTPGTFHIIVNSGESTRPGFQYEITFDYANYDIGFFDGPNDNFHSLTLGVKDPAQLLNPITDVFAKNAQGNPIGLVSTDGASIFFDSSPAEILAGGELVTIQFNQIPEPATLSLLALGGIALIRRRR